MGQDMWQRNRWRLRDVLRAMQMLKPTLHAQEDQFFRAGVLVCANRDLVDVYSDAPHFQLTLPAEPVAVAPEFIRIQVCFMRFFSWLC